MLKKNWFKLVFFVSSFLYFSIIALISYKKTIEPFDLNNIPLVSCGCDISHIPSKPLVEDRIIYKETQKKDVGKTSLIIKQDVYEEVKKIIKERRNQVSIFDFIIDEN